MSEWLEWFKTVNQLDNLLSPIMDKVSTHMDTIEAHSPNVLAYQDAQDEMIKSWRRFRKAVLEFVLAHYG